MEYSVLSASLTLGKALILLPHFLVGAWAFAASVLRKASPFVGVGGLVFVGAAGFLWAHGTIETYQCRAAARNGSGEWVTGVVSSVKYTYSKSGSGTLHFTVGGWELWSRSQGANNDCGFIEPLGKVGGVREGQSASVLLYDGKVIKFTSAP
jgi:hypothetical protein